MVLVNGQPLLMAMQMNQNLNFDSNTIPHSLGLLYSAFTYYLGFKVNSGEYKMMGLAPYGEQNIQI